MKLLQIILFCCALHSCASEKIIEKTPATTWCNPMNLSYRFNVDGDGYREAADPSVVKYKDKYWLFASKSGGYWWSEDLLSWNFVETKVLPTEDYAPTAVVYNDELYFLASFNNTEKLPLYKTTDPLNDSWTLAADYIFSYPGNNGRCIDPMLFADDDNRLYLHWGCSNKTPMWVCELDPANGFKPITQPIVTVDSDTINRGWEQMRDGRRPWIEGAWVNKVNGKYYLQYAATATLFDWYSDGYYVSDSAMGPYGFEKPNPFSIKPTGFARGAGHSTTFKDSFDNFWHLATNRLSVKHSYERRLSLYPTLFDSDGIPYCCTLWGDYPQRMPNSKFSNPEEIFTGWMLLSYNKTYSSSSTLDGFPVENAFNEDMSKYWSAATEKAGEWLAVDMGEDKNIYAIQVNFAEQDAKYSGIAKNISHKYIVQYSDNGKDWKTAIDKSRSEKDTPHDYIELSKPLNTRYIRIENISMPDGKFAVSGLRVFGLGMGDTPAAVKNFSVVRDIADQRNATMKWDEVGNATGYVIKYGTNPEKLYHNFIVYDADSLDTFLLNVGYPYWFSIAAFNDNGVSEYYNAFKIE